MADSNGWSFRPEPRTFHIIARFAGMWTLTQSVVTSDCTLWFYDRVYAQGREALMRQIVAGYL